MTAPERIPPDIRLPKAPDVYDRENEHQTRRLIELHTHRPAGAAGCPLFCGPGSPEGVITSPIGGIYEQTDAAVTSHAIWIKHEGTGNTGWRAWNGMRGGQGANTALRMGDGSVASAANTIAFGEGAAAPAAGAIAIGKDATAVVTKDIVIGDSADSAASSGPNTVGNIVIGPSASVAATDEEGHIVIGGRALVNADSTIRNSIVIGLDAKSQGRANVIIGELAEAKVATGGRTEGRFGVAIGYLAKLSGGCMVAVGDQSETRGDSTAAVGSHAKAYDDDAAAFGNGAYAGSIASDGTGGATTAIGAGTVARLVGAVSLGAYASATKDGGVALGSVASVSHSGSIALGWQAYSTNAGQLMIGGDYAPITEIAFNAAAPAWFISPAGVPSTTNPNSSSATSPKTANYSMTAGELQVWVSAAGGNRTITLPPGPASGLRVRVWRTDSSANTVTIQGDGTDTVEGSTYTLNPFGGLALVWATFEYDGAGDWFWVDGY